MIELGRRQVLCAAAAATTMTLPGSARAAWQDAKRYKEVFGLSMAYYEVGSGRPIVFLHGNPTSSYLWRNIIPYVEAMGRCIAPDLVGMGDSAKLPNSGPGVYTYKTHRRYLFELLRQLDLERDITFVVHDWGSALAFDFASHNPQSIRGIAYMEAIIRRPADEWRPDTPRGLFAAFRSPEGEQLVLQENAFVERLLIGSVNHYLTEEDKAEYRRPYREPGESRRPTLEWPRELPGASRENHEIARAYSAWLADSARVPKLFLHALPGAIFANKELLDFAMSLPNQKVVTVYGPHFVQEVSPHAIGRALAEWVAALG